jgi:hypothetical protein
MVGAAQLGTVADGLVGSESVVELPESPDFRLHEKTTSAGSLTETPLALRASSICRAVVIAGALDRGGNRGRCRDWLRRLQHVLLHIDEQ